MSAPAPAKAKALFELGQIVTTPGALAALSPAQMRTCLDRHVAGDCGAVCAEDIALNRYAILHGCSVMSAYPIDPTKPTDVGGGNTVWIITAGDRSVTTLLLPEEH